VKATNTTIPKSHLQRDLRLFIKLQLQKQLAVDGKKCNHVTRDG